MATCLVVAGLHALWDGTGSDGVRGVVAFVALTALVVVTHLLAADDRRRHMAQTSPLVPVTGPPR